MQKELAELICEKAKQLDPSDFGDIFYTNSLEDLSPFLYSGRYMCGEKTYAIPLPPEYVLYIVMNFVDLLVDDDNMPIYQVGRFYTDGLGTSQITY